MGEDRNVQPGSADPRLNGADRVLAALKRLGDYPDGARLDELARDLQSPKSSTHRALAALRRSGLVTQDGQGRYRLGLDLVQLAFQYYEQMHETAQMRPLLGALAERFGEAAHYARLEGSEIVYVGKMLPQGPSVQMTSVIGGRNPAHCTGLGKALLAYALRDRSEVDRYVREFGPLQRRTPNTSVTADALHRELVHTRRGGYATDDQENELGINCIAFAVFLGSPTTPSGAVSIAALAQRTPLRLLTAAAADIQALTAEHLEPGALSPTRRQVPTAAGV